MTGPTIGYATLPIIPSVRGLSQAIESQLGSQVTSAGRKAGNQVGQGMLASVRGHAAAAGRALASTLTAATTVAAGVAGTAAATAFSKGWTRLTTIQDATSALTISLGDSAAAASVLDDVLDTVRGTPFNLDQFARAGQQMVGMGIEAKKIPDYLTAIGEAAATQGGRANEYASRLSTVFGQVAASGQLTLADVWRISDTGVNALAILGNEFGVTTDEMKNMISSGAVPAGEALDALAKGILDGSTGPAGATVALAGTMEALRENMSGAVAGVEPALARLGAAVIAPFSPHVIAGANGLVDVIDRLAESAGAWADRLARSPSGRAALAMLKDLPGIAENAADGLAGILPAAGAGLAGITALGSQGLPIIGRFLPVINPVAAGLAALVMATPEARAALADVVRETGPLAADVAQRLVPALENLSELAGKVLPDGIGLFGDALGATLRVLGPVADALGVVTGFLADHGDLVLTVGLAWGAWRVAEGIFTRIGAGADTLAPKLYDIAGGFDKGFKAMGDIAGGVGGMMSNLMEVPAAGERIGTGFQAGATRARAGLRQLGVSISNIVAGAGVTALVSLGVAWQRAGGQAKAAIAEMKPPDFDHRMLQESYEYLHTVSDAAYAASEGMEDAFGPNVWSHVGASAKAVGEGMASGIGIGTAATLTQIRTQEELNAEMERADAITRSLHRAYGEIGESVFGFELEFGPESLPIHTEIVEEIEGWIQKLDLDPTTQSVEDMSAAIQGAKLAAEQGSPAIDTMSEAYTTLAEETSSATEKMSAWKGLVDSILGVELDVFDADTSFRQALDALTRMEEDAEGALRPVLDLSAGLDGASDAALANRGALSQAARAAISLAEAYGDQHGIDAATFVLAANREELRKTMVQAGLTEKQVEDYLDQLGLTPDNIKTIVEAETEAAETSIDNLIRKYRDAEVRIKAKILESFEGPEIVSWGMITGGGSLQGGRASGGPVWPGTWLVGEEGPELLTLGGQGHVYDAAETSRMLGGDGGDGGGRERRSESRRPSPGGGTVVLQTVDTDRAIERGLWEGLFS